jgi:hypothetical protein
VVLCWDAALILHLLNIGERGEVLARNPVDRQMSRIPLPPQRACRHRAIRKRNLRGDLQPQIGIGVDVVREPQLRCHTASGSFDDVTMI